MVEEEEKKMSTPTELKTAFPCCLSIEVEEKSEMTWEVKSIDLPTVKMVSPMLIKQTSEGTEGGPITATYEDGIDVNKLTGKYGDWMTKIYIQHCVRLFVLLDQKRRQGEEPQEEWKRLSCYFEAITSCGESNGLRNAL